MPEKKICCIYLNCVSEGAYSFEPPVFSLLRKSNSEIILFDADEKSDAFMMDYALRLVRESEKCFFIIRQKEDARSVPQKMNMILNYIPRLKNEWHIILENKNDFLEKFFSKWMERVMILNDAEKIFQHIQKFL